MTPARRRRLVRPCREAAGDRDRLGVPVVNSIVLAVDRESRDAATRC
jgi:hypothetical protein